MGRTLLILLLLAAANVLVYGRTASFDFVAYDDPGYVANHPHVPDGLTAEGAGWVLANGHKGLWMPVTSLSYMLDVELGGLEPRVFHVTNVVLHVLNASLVFALLRLSTGAFWRSALVAALFALHPLRVEPVAWIASRKDLLSTTFGLLAMLAWIPYARRRSLAGYAGALLCFALGLGAKPMLVTLPFVLLLLDYWPLGRLAGGARPLRLLLEKLPFFVLSAAASVVAYRVQVAGGAVSSGAELSGSATSINALVSTVRYLWMTIWPGDLCVLYPHPYIEGGGGTPYAPWQIAGAGFVFCVLTVVFLASRTRPWARTGWLWYLGTLGPVIGLVQFGRQALADRFTYLPSIGLLVVVVWWGAELLARGPRLRAVGAALAAVWLVVLATVAWKQTGTWRDSVTLFEQALAVEPENTTMLNNLATERMLRGENREAIELLERAVELQPAYGKAHYNLAGLLHARGRLDGAIEHYRQAAKYLDGAERAEARSRLRRVQSERNAGRGEETP